MQNRQKVLKGELLLTHIFNDFDHFTEQVRGGDYNMTLCAVEERIWRVSAVDLPGAMIQHGYLGSGNLVEGQSDKSGTLLYIPLSEVPGQQSANGVTLDSHSCMTLRPGTEFDLCIRGWHEWGTVFINSDDLPGAGGPEDSTESIVSRCSERDLRMFRDSVRTIMSVARSSTEFESSSAGKHASKFLQELAGRIVANPFVESSRQERVRHGRPAYSRRDIVLRCRSFLEEHPRSRASVTDLVRASQVSERTLRNAFNSYFGLSPSRYLQIRLLNHVHKDLLSADPETGSVTRTLLRHGVWEFGRFASRYSQLYGELPSVTLSRH